MDVLEMAQRLAWQLSRPTAALGGCGRRRRWETARLGARLSGRLRNPLETGWGT